MPVLAELGNSALHAGHSALTELKFLFQDSE